MDEENLIVGLLNGVAEKDESDFGKLYEATQRKVFHYLLRVTNSRELAEDLLIETYTEVWKSAKKFQGRSKVITWIIGIARNLAMNQIRKNRMEDTRLEGDPAYPSDQFLHSARAEKLQILEEALNRLSLKHREILDLVFLQEMAYEDIAQIMRLPVNTVKTRVFYAKEKLRAIMTGMGVKKDDLL